MKDEFIYFNDQWNGKWIDDPKKEIEIIEVEKTKNWINIEHFWFEMYSQGKITKKELELRLKNK